MEHIIKISIKKKFVKIVSIKNSDKNSALIESMQMLEMGPQHKMYDGLQLTTLNLRTLEWKEINPFLTVYIRHLNEYITGTIHTVKEESFIITWQDQTETTYYKDEFEYIQSSENPNELILVKENEYNELRPVPNPPNQLKKRIDDIDNLFHLHACEQEGLLSGKPSAKEWFDGEVNAEEAWNIIKKFLKQFIK